MEANPDFTSLSTSQLESSITQLCADLNAATYRQLMMIAEFDTRQGWGEEGVRSCAHWLSWRCGISLGAAREKVRVAHALSNLPKTCEAFSSGILSYSKVRAITRVGTKHNEDCLLSFARYGTATHLDKTVRLYRQQYNHAGQYRVDYHQSAVPVDTDSNTDTTDAQRWDAENQGAMHNKQHRQLFTHWDEHGCLTVKARLTAEQGALVIKAIEAAVESIKEREPNDVCETHATALHALTSSENAPAEAFAESTSVSYREPSEQFKLANQHAIRRRSDALVLMAEAFLRDTKVASCTDDRYQVVVHVDSKVLAKEVFECLDGKPDCYIEQQAALPVETARRLSCSCKIVTALTHDGEPLNIGRSSRAIPTGIRRALAIRDTICSFPGCDCHKNLDAHHIQHWANGGETSLSNLTHVCHHHHSLLHEGQYSVERLSDRTLLFKRPDGSAIVHRAATKGKQIPATLNEPWSWCGDSMDYGTALYNIACHDRSAEANKPSS